MPLLRKGVWEGVVSRFKGRYKDLQRMVEGLNARHVAVYELQSCQLEESLQEVLARMDTHDIDVMPVDAGADSFDSYLLRADLRKLPESAKVNDYRL